MVKSTQQRFNFLIEISFTSSCKNQFINLPYKLIIWFLYDEIVDRYEVI